jgi:hypothetical protein
VFSFGNKEKMDAIDLDQPLYCDKRLRLNFLKYYWRNYQNVIFYFLTSPKGSVIPLPLEVRIHILERHCLDEDDNHQVIFKVYSYDYFHRPWKVRMRDDVYEHYFHRYVFKATEVGPISRAIVLRDIVHNPWGLTHI